MGRIKIFYTGMVLCKISFHSTGPPARNLGTSSDFRTHYGKAGMWLRRILRYPNFRTENDRNQHAISLPRVLDQPCVLPAVHQLNHEMRYG